MFNSYQENYSLLYFSEGFKLITEQLTTNVHYNKKNCKSYFINEDDDPFNCSFDQRKQKGHAQAIWNASLDYVRSALVNSNSCLRGFNDYQQIYDYRQDQNSIVKRNFLDYYILRNDIMTTEEEHAFIRILKNQSELKELVEELQQMFRGSVFQELSYLIFKIYQKRKQLLTFSKKNNKTQLFNLPPVNCFLNLQNWEPLLRISYSPYEDKKPQKEVENMAAQCSKQISNEMYYDRRIKLINLRECKKECRSQDQIRQLFLSFFKILTEKVYLSLEGFFSDFQIEQKYFLDTDSCDDLESNFDQTNSQSQIEMIPNKKSYIRKLDQSQMMDDESEKNNEGRKKTKLF